MSTVMLAEKQFQGRVEAQVHKQSKSPFQGCGRTEADEINILTPTQLSIIQTDNVSFQQMVPWGIYGFIASMQC